MKILSNIHSILLFFFILLLFGGTSTFSAGGIGGYPTNPTDPENSGWFMYNAEAGDIIEDSVTVVNSSNDTWIVDIYPADSMKSSGGGFALKQRSEEMTEMGSWITMEKESITLKPQEKQEIDFTIKFPKNMDFGQTSGAILFEKRAPEEGESSGGGVKINLRTGVRIYQTTPGEISEILEFDVMEIEESTDGSKVLHSEVINTGNISSTAKFITTFTLGGQTIIKESAFLVERNDTFYNNIALGTEDLPLPFVGQVHIQTEAFIKKRDGSEVSIGTKEISFYIIPPLLIGIAGGVTLLIILFILWFFILRKKKHKEKPSHPPQNTQSAHITPPPSPQPMTSPVPQVQPDTTGWKHFTLKKEMSLTDVLHGIHHDTDFEHVASVNNLKPPYIIPAGTSVLLPPPAKS